MSISIEDLRRNDETAWEEAYSSLFSISMRVLSPYFDELDHQAMEDIAQVSLIEAMDYLRKPEGISEFKQLEKLVFQITKNRIQDAFRKRDAVIHGGGKLESLEAKEDHDAEDLNFETAPEQLQREESKAIIDKALAQIHQKYAKVVEDLYFNGFSQQKTADRNGLQLGSIGPYKTRGLEALFDFLKKDGFLL